MRGDYYVVPPNRGARVCAVIQITHTPMCLSMYYCKVETQTQLRHSSNTPHTEDFACARVVAPAPTINSVKNSKRVGAISRLVLNFGCEDLQIHVLGPELKEFGPLRS